jgi:2-methylcitrate dehydratase PrpD
MLGAGGLRAAFGTDGKALQVGTASAHGVRGAMLSAAGANATAAIEEAFDRAYGGTWAEPIGSPAIWDNWIKAFPCCLQTHSAIEAAEAAAGEVDPSGAGVVTVHPRSRQAAPLDDVTTGLEAKFSIPYTVAFTLLRGSPTVDSFINVDSAVRAVASRIEVRLDESLQQSEAILSWGTGPSPVEIRVDAARGSPQHPMTDEQLDAKVHSLAGDHLFGSLDDDAAKARDLLERLAAT